MLFCQRRDIDRYWLAILFMGRVLVYQSFHRLAKILLDSPPLPKISMSVLSRVYPNLRAIIELLSSSLRLLLQHCPAVLTLTSVCGTLVGVYLAGSGFLVLQTQHL